MRTLILTFVFVFAPLLACTTGGTSSRTGSSGSRTLITREQLDATPSVTALQVIERLHREWLRGRAGTLRTDSGRNTAEVFLDGRPYGGLEVLNQFDVANIQEIRFISASDATTRYGTGYPSGIIELVSRRAPDL